MVYALEANWIRARFDESYRYQVLSTEKQSDANVEEEIVCGILERWPTTKIMWRS